MERETFIARQHTLTASMWGIGYDVGEVVRADDRVAKVSGRRFVGLDDEGVGMFEVAAEHLAGAEADQAARALTFDQHFIGLLPVPSALAPTARPLASKTGANGAVCAVHRERRDLIFTRLLPHPTVPVLRMKRERATAGLLAGARAWDKTAIAV